MCAYALIGKLPAGNYMAVMADRGVIHRVDSLWITGVNGGERSPLRRGLRGAERVNNPISTDSRIQPETGGVG